MPIVLRSPENIKSKSLTTNVINAQSITSKGPLGANTLQVDGIATLNGGLNMMRKDGRNTHFDWADGKNYIRGDNQMDGNTNISGVLTVNGNAASPFTTFNGTATAQGPYASWNAACGNDKIPGGCNGATQFINQQGGGSGGFQFINYNGDGTFKNQEMNTDGSGNLNVSNDIKATGNIKANNDIQAYGNLFGKGVYSNGVTADDIKATGNMRVENGFSMGGEGELSVDAPGVVGGRFVVDKGGNVRAKGDIRSNSIGRESADDWFRIFGTNNAGTALYNGLSVNDNGGVSIGKWGRPPKGVLRTTGAIVSGMPEGEETPGDWSGVNMRRRDGRWTHFDWISDQKNYIRGDTIIDGAVNVNGPICSGQWCFQQHANGNLHIHRGDINNWQAALTTNGDLVGRTSISKA